MYSFSIQFIFFQSLLPASPYVQEVVKSCHCLSCKGSDMQATMACFVVITCLQYIYCECKTNEYIFLNHPHFLNNTASHDKFMLLVGCEFCTSLASFFFFILIINTDELTNMHSHTHINTKRACSHIIHITCFHFSLTQTHINNSSCTVQVKPPNTVAAITSQKSHSDSFLFLLACDTNCFFIQ